MSNTTQLSQHIEFLKKEKNNQSPQFERFLIDKNRLRLATYSSKGRMSRAILSFYASNQPKDWEHCDRPVLVENIFFSTDKPNLHHIFPTNSEYVINNQHKNKITSDSLMNIAYITQITNLDITNRNPLEYIRDYDKQEFENIMPTHYLPASILTWAREEKMPDNAIDTFIEERLNILLEDLRLKLTSISFDVIDTSEFVDEKSTS